MQKQKKIHLLTEETINQIAAGQVVEGPASVVKELVENALDAEAKKIRVEISGGGLKSIRIVDDGVGMSEEDAKACILRHATSKIAKVEDLFHIQTKGFRGEALASIASISKMTLYTAYEDASGIELEIENGKITRQKPCARTRGTTIEVRSLFYNVPVRKKFQKNTAAISAEIFRMMTILALSHPDVQFELISNRRKVIHTMAKNMQGRAKELLGEEFVRESFPLEFFEGPLHFTGLIGSPTNTRVNKLGQFLFLNRRAVSCEPIYEAVRFGYGTMLDTKRHPIFLLYLEAPTDLIDVNFDPRKLQVRLRKEELFRNKVQEAVAKALKIQISDIQEVHMGREPFTEVPVSYEGLSLRLQEEIVEEKGFLEGEFYETLGQIDRFLLYYDQTTKEAVFVDVKAASFRIFFENILEKHQGKIESQKLLIPFTIHLTPLENTMVLTHMDAIEMTGFSLTWIGKESFMVEAIPSFLEESSVQPLISNMAMALQEFIGVREYAKQRKEKLALLAAQYAKYKKKYSSQEAMHFLKELLVCKNALFCPLGSPIMVRMTNEQIEELFTKNPKTAESSSS